MTSPRSGARSIRTAAVFAMVLWAPAAAVAGEASAGDEVEPRAWLALLIPVLLVVGGINLVRGIRARRRMAGFAGGIVPVRDLKDGTAMVSGVATTVEPLRSPITGTECVFYEHSVEEEWHKVRTERKRRWVPDPDFPDGPGLEVTDELEVHSSGVEKVGGDRRAVPFYVRDTTGEVLVVPDRADIEAATTFAGKVDRSSPHYDVPGARTLGLIGDGGSTGVRRLHEEVIPNEAQVTVVGPVETGNEGPQIRWPKRWRGPSARNRFLVTVEDAGRAEHAERRRMVKSLAIAAVSLVGIVVIIAMTAEWTGPTLW